MSIGTILNIAQSALNASQVSIQTTSHNIANVDTPGYTEQEAVLEEAQPTPTAVGLMGDGVTVTQIKSYVDQSLQNAITSKNSDVQEQQTYETNLTQIQSIFNEDNSKLSSSMTTFFNDWSTLSTDPTSTADKQTVASDGQSLCTTVNTMYGDLTSLQSNLNGEVGSEIQDVNTTISQIASLNQLIAEGQKGTSEANDYIDQRSQLVQTLSGHMNISTFTDTSNMVHVLTSSGSTLVDGVTSYQLTVDPNTTTGLTDVGWQGPSGQVTDITSQISGGSLGALLTTRDATIPGYMSNLNGMAQSIMQNVNYFHEQGNNNAGIPFFQSTTANYAQGISLASQIENASGDVQTQNVMASSSTADATSNDVATAIASLANDTILGGGTITSAIASSETTPLGLSGTLAINGVPITVGVGDSLSVVAASINGIKGQTGVTASVAQTTSGGYQLVLTAQGSNDNISVVNGDLDTSSQNLLQTLTSTPVTNTGTAMNLTGTIQLGQGKSVTVAATDSLTTVEGNINADTATTGITASISGSNTLVLSTGAGTISIPDNGTPTGTIGLAGATYTDYEAGVVANIGQATENATNLADYNQSALTSLQQQQSQESGVSIDDEMSNLIKFQNAYQAAARIFTVAQSMVDTLLAAAGVTTS